MAITFNPEKLQEVLERCKAHFEEQWENEEYKCIRPLALCQNPGSPYPRLPV